VDYVARNGSLAASEGQQPEDSLSRELVLRDDTADELVRHVLQGDREALGLWYRTRAWVIAGQRRTLARLGVAFDHVFFESDFLADATELTESGLRDGQLIRRADGVVVYQTGLEDLEEFPLVRADGLPTQHLRSLVYWQAAPGLSGFTSVQVCGTEWVSHVTCRRQLMHELEPSLNGGMHPKHDIFNGMVSQQKRALSSSEGALLVDELTDWIDERIDIDPTLHALRQAHPAPERIAAQVALGFFLPHPVAPRIDFEPETLFNESESMGWVLVKARATCGRGAGEGRPAHDPEYRFAALQSELYRRYLRLAVQRLDVRPLAHYVRHLAAWYLEEERDERVERVVHTLLDRSARGLGLEPAA
jgi:hypothetical protein